MILNRLVKVLTAQDPLERLREPEAKRLTFAIALAVGAAAAAMAALALLAPGLGLGAHVTLGLGVMAAVFLGAALALWMGAPARPAAAVVLAAGLAVSAAAQMLPGGTGPADLPIQLLALMLFAGATLGRPVMTAIGALAVIVGLSVAFVRTGSHPPEQLGNAPGMLILAEIWRVSAILIAMAVAWSALRSYREALQALREARDEARRANLAKSAFLANTSHEIRTPLNGVLGMAQVLETTELTPKQRRYLATISESGHTLLALLNDVLDLSKVEAGQIDIAPAPTDIRAMMAGVADAWRPIAADKGLSLSMHMAADLPETLSLDAVRARQCVENLVSNAVKFTRHGGVAIKVEGTGAGAAHVLRVAVADSGPGIHADILPRVFEPFQQAPQPDDQGVKGTGLGLAIVRNLARMMGGDITAESEVDRGSTFTLTLAAPAVARPPSAAPAKAAANGNCHGNGVAAARANGAANGHGHGNGNGGANGHDRDDPPGEDAPAAAPRADGVQPARPSA